MKVLKKPGLWILALFLIGCVWFGVSLARRISEVNYPNPDTYPLGAIERMVSRGKTQVHVEKALYIDRDTNAFIFIGTIVKLPSREPLKVDGQLPESKVKAYFPDIYGTVLMTEVRGRQIWGIAREGAWTETSYSDRRFREKYENLIQTWARKD